ncbi:MAG: APC family permease [Lutibacter sp.]|uniref:APC family permease n=1 Tax=Lutibacter sp. TaxID=1925666 RepID=UPI00299F2253|nr:APC family permease [Lutibacter sp.]MDX1828853.1 APC family permease [Lutibacter sp.]
MNNNYKKDSISLIGAVALGTGVMIGAGIFALLGQVAELSGNLFPFAFIVGAIISGFSAYGYIKMSNAFPSSGGIAMYLVKAYGKGTVAASSALLMAFSMIINESLVARTFGSYTLQLFNVSNNGVWVSLLGVFLIVGAFLINISGNNIIGKSSLIMAIIKVGGIAIFAIATLWIAGFSFQDSISVSNSSNYVIADYLGALALSILAYKGFTTITNSGGEIVNPNKNVGRAIVISLVICTVIYLLVAFAVSSSLTISEIVTAKDYSLAEASKPAFGKYGLWFTVGIAIAATISGIIASIFAVSRMMAMLTNMKLIPHNHFGMSGNIQRHMLVYVAIIAILLTIFFDLSRIASLGAIFYLVMDIGVQWGILKNLRKEIKANSFMVLTAIILDIVVLSAFLWIKASSDITVIIVALVVMMLIFFGEKWFLKRNNNK